MTVDPLRVAAPRARVRLEPYRPDGSARTYWCWRVLRCPHCGSARHEHGFLESEARMRNLLGRVVEAGCHRAGHQRYYVLTEEAPM